MKNVKCRKLQINRTKAPDKVGTLKDISLYRSFQFPTSGTYSGGLIARSLSAVGKELKKTKAQIQALSNRTSPIAGATGATTTEDFQSPASSAVRRSFGQESYNLRFIQHAPDPVVPVSMRPLDGESRSRVEKAGYALKMGEGKRVVFMLEQKEIMIEFNNRQANYGIRANPDDCIAAMRLTGVSMLKESQIKSWWSTYHQKQKRERERLDAELQNLHTQVTPVNGNVTAVPVVITLKGKRDCS